MGLDSLRAKFDGTTGLDEGEAFNRCTDFIVESVKATADSMAADVTAATKFWCNAFDFNLRIVSGKVSPTNTLTAHDTNNAVITIERDDGANSTPAAALTWTTSTTAAGGTGNWAVDTPINNTSRTDANSIMVPSSQLHFAIAKGGTGVVVPISRYYVRLRRIG